MTDTDTKLSQGVLERLKRAARADTFAGASNALFGGIVDRYGYLLQSLEPDLERADIRVLYRTYVSEMLFGMVLAMLSGLGIAAILIVQFSPPAAFASLLIALLPVTLGLLVFTAMYLYPSYHAGHRARSINRNLPFALNHMSAVAGSGVPPVMMFQLLLNFDEYGEISAEAEKVVTRVKAFGEDFTSAMRDVAESTPSADFREVLYGIISTNETGGSLEQFLNERAERALFDYRIKREKEIQRLTTFASFYTAVLVAAPLFLVTILAVLELVGGTIAGFPIKASCGVIGALLGQCQIGVIDMGAYFIIPALNVLFIIAMEVFQPEI